MKKLMFILIVIFVAICTNFDIAKYTKSSHNTIPRENKGEEVYRAKIYQINNAIDKNKIYLQIIKARIANSSPIEEVTIENRLSGGPTDIKYSQGDLVFIKRVEGTDRFYIRGPVRDHGLLLITLIFIGFVIIIGGLQGIRAIISLVMVSVFIFKILIPAVIKGYDPVLLTLGISALATVITLFFVNGNNGKTIAAIIGTVSGLITAALLSITFGNMVHLIGYSDESMQLLRFASSSPISCRGLLFSGIIIGALGAVMDVAMSISSSVWEIKTSNPHLSQESLFWRGLKVGKDITGTMTNTLILAYVGSSFPLLLLFNIYETSFIHILNMDEIASELIRMMAGSIGLVSAVPVTALAAAFFSVKTE